MQKSRCAHVAIALRAGASMLALLLIAACGSAPTTRGVSALTPAATQFAAATLVATSADRSVDARRRTAKPDLWFHPMPSAAVLPGAAPGYGSQDFGALFTPSAPWPHVLANTAVFGLYAGFVTGTDPATLAMMVGFLNAHHIAIELEAPALQASTACGNGIEGYAPSTQSLQTFTLAYLQRLKSLGADVAYLKVDEPLWFGSMSPTGCQFSVANVAMQTAAFTNLVHTVYPTLAVGDVEPIVASAYSPNIVSALAQWHQQYAQAEGSPFPFFIADNDFSNPAWPSIDKALELSTRARRMQFGVIYIGEPTDTSDAQWVNRARLRYETYQGRAGGRPDFVLFQSWEAHPNNALPESNPATFTGLLNTYLQRF